MLGIGLRIPLDGEIDIAAYGSLHPIDVCHEAIVVANVQPQSVDCAGVIQIEGNANVARTISIEHQRLHIR